LAAAPSIGRATAVEAPPTAREAELTRALYERYANQIYGFCLHKLGSREEAEDAVQTTFLNAFRGLGRGMVPQAESAWLFKIAENVCTSRHRSSFRRRRLESPSDLEALQDVIPGREPESDQLVGLERVLEKMPENQRRAILLREWQGLSYREISEEMELSQSAVETLIFRARRSLAQGLETVEEDRAPLRKRLRNSIDFGGGLLAGLKTFLGSAAAVKTAATVVAVTSASVVASVPTVQHRQHRAVRPHRAAAPTTSARRQTSVSTPVASAASAFGTPSRSERAARRGAPAGAPPAVRRQRAPAHETAPAAPVPEQPQQSAPAPEAAAPVPEPQPTPTPAPRAEPPQQATPPTPAPTDGTPKQKKVDPPAPAAPAPGNAGNARGHDYGHGHDTQPAATAPPSVDPGTGRGTDSQPPARVSQSAGPGNSGNAPGHENKSEKKDVQATSPTAPASAPAAPQPQAQPPAQSPGQPRVAEDRAAPAQAPAQPQAAPPAQSGDHGGGNGHDGNAKKDK
jgi:RNA polymerase sigma factor (sigma-70 family)